MKIAIHTISDDNNFGNRLQNFALTKVLNNENKNSVVTLQDYNSQRNYYSFFNSLSLTQLYLILICIKAKVKGIPKDEIMQYYKYKRRERVFRKFTKHYVPKFKNTIYSEEEFSLYVIGSDQIWNPQFRKNLSNDFLPNVTRAKVISFAASIGLENLSLDTQSIIANGVSQLSAISVRENSAKKIIQKLSRCKVYVHVDPTMLLSKEDWHVLSEKSNRNIRIDQNFVVTYFLGEITDKERKYVYEYASNINASVVELNNVNNKSYSKIGPLEFLWLFENSKAIFADSYHAAVFSIIFNKYFEIFNRHDSFSKMNTRMETLFENFELETRIHDLDSDPDVLPEVDYRKIESILIKKRHEAKQWLGHYIN
ncbi:polysaccharide pyruvyl transferase family protein [Weissella paramesenteroides]|uniref:polysaccharide pyruvyl transferase family protein n=1 Tax=Weissella paramesenteroides TaxID=1249 RepID=UPI003D36CCBC